MNDDCLYVPVCRGWHPKSEWQAASNKPQAASNKRLDKSKQQDYIGHMKGKKMTQKQKISEIIEILNLLTKRVKKIEKDVLKACTQKIQIILQVL